MTGGSVDPVSADLLAVMPPRKGHTFFHQLAGSVSKPLLELTS